MSQQKVRQAALDALLKIEDEEGYSNVLLDQAVKKHDFSSKDKALLTRLVYGTVQHKNTLNFYVKSLVKKRPEDWIHMLLCLALYQMIYLERVPDRAVVHETVEIAKHRGHKGMAAFVNGVLRNVQRQEYPDLKDIEDPRQRLALQTSHPNWLLERWQKQYGMSAAEKICEANNTLPHVTARINVQKTNKEDLMVRLQEEGVEVEPGNLVSEAVKIHSGILPNTQCYQNGLLTIQDESSMLVTDALDLADGMHVLDACAAPGGKTTHIAERLSNSGRVTALDIYDHKVNLIKDQAQRLGLTNVSAECLDSLRAKDHFRTASFDRILVDAPCSGFGVIRRKPDIKWHKTPVDIDKLAEAQFEILQALMPLLKPGGKLVYSTCTIEKEENENVIASFLQKHPEFFIDTYLPYRLPITLQSHLNSQNAGVQLLPFAFHTDGFYLAALQKGETR